MARPTEYQGQGHSPGSSDADLAHEIITAQHLLERLDNRGLLELYDELRPKVERGDLGAMIMVALIGREASARA